MKKELALRTLLYLQILISLQISFTFLNSVFFIYKYEQLQNNRDISIIVFCIPSLVYHVVKLFFCYFKRYFIREETTGQYTGNGNIKGINNNILRDNLCVSNEIKGCEKVNKGIEGKESEKKEENKDLDNTALNTCDNDNTLIEVGTKDNTSLNISIENNTLLNVSTGDNTPLNICLCDNTPLNVSTKEKTPLSIGHMNNTLLNNNSKLRRELNFLKSFYTNLYKKGYTLSIAISILLKTLSYFIDRYFLRKYICCIFLSLINIIISINDIYYTSVLERLKSGIENGVLLSVFIDEIPTYMFVGFFSYLEWMFNKSVKPYFDLCSIVYLISGLLLWRVSRMGVIKEINDNGSFSSINSDRSVIKERNRKGFNEKKCVFKGKNGNECKYKGVNDCNDSYCNEWGVNNKNDKACVNYMTTNINVVNEPTNGIKDVNNIVNCIKGVNNCNDYCCNRSPDTIDLIQMSDYVSLYTDEERSIARINPYLCEDKFISNKNISMDSSLTDENGFEEFNDVYTPNATLYVLFDKNSDEKTFNLDNISNELISKNVNNPTSMISGFGNITKSSISENNLSIPDSNTFMAFLLLVGKTICTMNDTLIYFFLITDMSEESYLLLYFSVEFLLKTIQIQVRRWFYHFMVFKCVVALLCLYFVVYRNILQMYFFTFFLFIINGVTNQMMYYTFNRKVEGCVGEHICDLLVFFVVSTVELYFHRKGGKSFKDFIFFTTIRL